MTPKGYLWSLGVILHKRRIFSNGGDEAVLQAKA
jgi:hypothetical protein